MPRPYPSVSKAQWASVRAKVDARFHDIVRSLEDSYYGTALTWDGEGLTKTRAADGWRDGVSHPFVTGPRTYDKEPTLAENKLLFDKLHGVIWMHYTVAMVDQNIADGNPHPRMDEETQDVEKGRVPGQASDEVRFRVVTLSRKAIAQQKIDELGIEGIEVTV